MKIIALALAATLALGATAHAQTARTDARDADAVGPVAGDWEGTLSGTGTSDNNFDNHTFGVSGSVGKYLTDNVLVGVRQSVNFADVENGDDQTNFATRVFADYVFDLGAFRPYVGINFGGIYGDNVNDTLAAGPQLGLKYYADKRTFVYLQAEYQFTFDDADEIGEAADDGQYFYTLGIGINF